MRCLPMLKKEIFIYSELIPTYQRLQLQMNIKENEIIDIVPKYFGHRYYLDGDTKRDDDQHALFAVENMAVKGYYTCNKLIGKFIHPLLCDIYV